MFFFFSPHNDAKCLGYLVQTFQAACQAHRDAAHVDEEVHRFFLEEVPTHLVPKTQHRCHIGFMDSPGFSKHLKITGGAWFAAVGQQSAGFSLREKLHPLKQEFSCTSKRSSVRER